ncbi:MAG TPA: hypothetical protein VIY52_23505, partial [Streptosporangiaceae bacterium]
ASCHANLNSAASSSPSSNALRVQRHRTLPLHQQRPLPNHVQTTWPTTSQDAEEVVQEHRKVTHIEIVEDVFMGVGNDAGDSGPGSGADNVISAIEL